MSGSEDLRQHLTRHVAAYCKCQSEPARQRAWDAILGRRDELEQVVSVVLYASEAVERRADRLVVEAVARHKYEGPVAVHDDEDMVECRDGCYEYRRYVELLQRLVAEGLPAYRDAVTRALLWGQGHEHPDVREAADDLAECARCGSDELSEPRSHLLCGPCRAVLEDVWFGRTNERTAPEGNLRNRVPPWEWAKSNCSGVDWGGSWLSSEFKRTGPPSDEEVR